MPVMPELPERKVGIIACSGEELAEGTVTRLAALKVLHELRRGRTVTMPAALSRRWRGRPGVRAFPPDDHGGRVRPSLRGARHGVSSGKPTASLVVRDLPRRPVYRRPPGAGA